MAVPDSYPVVYHSQDGNSLTLTGAAGSLQAILQAVLVNGVDVRSVTQIIVTDEVATATSASHGYSINPGALLLISGASVSGLNGRVQPIAVDTNTFSYAAPGVADGTYTGTMSVKRAPAGWAEDFVSGNISVFRPTDLEANGYSLRVDDSTTLYARAVGYESMTGASTGVGPFPTDGQVAGGLYWPKANNTTGTRSWLVVADGKVVYVYVQATAANVYGSIYGFGDLLLPDGVVDPWATMISGHLSALYTGGVGCLSEVAAATSLALVMARPASGVGVQGGARLVSGLRTGGVSGGTSGSLLPAYPNASHGELLLFRPLVISDSGVRGSLRLLRHTPQVINNAIAFDSQTFPNLNPVSTYVGAAGLAFVSTEGA